MLIMKSLKGGSGTDAVDLTTNFFELSFVMNHLSTKFLSVLVTY